MTYNIYTFSPNDLIQDKFTLVEENLSMKVEEVLSSPTFQWGPCLCVVAVDNDSQRHKYAGIFSDTDEIIYVSKGSYALSLFIARVSGEDLFDFWKNGTDGYAMASVVKETVSAARLNEIRKTTKERMTQYIASISLNRPSKYIVRDPEYYRQQMSIARSFEEFCVEYGNCMTAFDGSIAARDIFVANTLREIVPFYEVVVGLLRLA